MPTFGNAHLAIFPHLVKLGAGTCITDLLAVTFMFTAGLVKRAAVETVCKEKNKGLLQAFANT